MTRPPDTFLIRRSYPGGRQAIDVGRYDQRANIVVDRHPRSLEVRVAFSNPPTLSSPCTGIELRVCPRSASLLEASDLSSPTWHFAAGLLPVRSRDVFSQVMDVTYHKVVRTAGLPYEPQLDLPFCFQGSRHGPDRCSSQFVSSIASSMQIVAEALRGAAVHATRLCDPDLLRLVRRFSPGMRLWLYQSLARDSSRRLAQLTTTCPGALVFAFALREHEPMRPVADQLLCGAVAGRRLNLLLNEAVSGWAAAAADWDTEREPQLARPWLRLLDAGADERRRLEAGQRLLVRRAGPRTAPTHLLIPPPLAFAPEDIPRGVYENARWFRTLKARADLVAPHVDQAEGLLCELSHFASRHFRALHPPRRRAVMGRRMGQLIDYVLAAGRHTSRRTCPERLLAECSNWHRNVYRNLELCSTPGQSPVTPETQFPGSGIDSWSDGRVVATRIRTVGELLAEGRRMRHCVGSRAKAALVGRCSIYSVAVDGRPITVELNHLPNGRSYLSEVAGFANRAVGDQELRAMAPWLESIRARD